MISDTDASFDKRTDYRYPFPPVSAIFCIIFLILPYHVYIVKIVFAHFSGEFTFFTADWGIVYNQ